MWQITVNDKANHQHILNLHKQQSVTSLKSQKEISQTVFSVLKEVEKTCM